MAFSPLGNSGHVVSDSFYFWSNSKEDASFHHIAYEYSRADWDGFHDHFMIIAVVYVVYDFFIDYNPKQNIWNKVRKLSKILQD